MRHLILPAALALAACAPSSDSTSAAAEYGPGDSYYSWCFAFEDGWSDCGTSTSNNALIHDMTVHVSCSADFTGGYASKEQPREDLGDPRVVDYSIQKLKVQSDGSLTVEKECADTVATEVDCDTGDTAETCWDFSTSSVCPDFVTDTWSSSVKVYCFEFADGYSECGEVDGSTTVIYDMVVHTSCSADYDELGYPNKDHPQADLGEPAVVSYSIIEYRWHDGVCDEVVVKCGEEFDVVPSECPVVPECITLAEAVEAGDATIYSDGTSSVVIENSGEIDICLDAWYAAISPGAQDGIIGTQDAAIGGTVIPAGESFVMAYGSYTTDNGVYAPDLGEDPWWCLELGQDFASGYTFGFDGAELPGALTRFWLEAADRDGDGVDDRVDWVDVQGVEAQYQLWAYLESSAVWLIGQSDHYSYLTEGETVPVELIATNLGAVAGTGTVSWTLPSGLVPLNMSHSPDSVTAQADGSVVYTWTVSADGRTEGTGYTYDTDVISLDLYVLDLSCTGREAGIVPTLDWTDSAGDAWTSQGTALVLECCESGSSSYDIDGDYAKERKWWKDHFKKVRDGSPDDHLSQAEADALIAAVNDFFLSSADHGDAAPFTIDSYDEAVTILDEKAASGETGKMLGELLAAQLNYHFGWRMYDEDANLRILHEAELVAWQPSLYTEDEIKALKELLKDVNGI